MKPGEREKLLKTYWEVSSIFYGRISGTKVTVAHALAALRAIITRTPSSRLGQMARKLQNEIVLHNADKEAQQ